MSDPVQPDVSLKDLASVIKEADDSGESYAEYLKRLRDNADAAADELNKQYTAWIEVLRLNVESAKAKLTAALALADVCSATKSKRTRKDAGKSRPKTPATAEAPTVQPNAAVPSPPAPKQPEDAPF